MKLLTWDCMLANEQLTGHSILHESNYAKFIPVKMISHEE